MVPPGSSLDAKEQVRAAIDIVELIGAHLPLRRQGSAYVGLCPWHDDSRPSLQVNPDRQSFKCWVCDVGGDVFSFVMKMEGVDFSEALRMLAEKAGISLSGHSTADSSGGVKQPLYEALMWAERLYHDYLMQSPAGESARHYLLDRGISEDSMKRFHLGLAPEDWNWLTKQPRDKAITARHMETAGLVAENRGGTGHYDRFRGRALFSIRDPQGRPVGFGGRLLPGVESTNPAKYVNSPETPLFTKNRLLYALDVAREAIRKSGTALVMEGYTDVIVAHQFGFHNAVAVLGTALGERHVQLLRRYADRVILVLDGDAAGQARANEILGLFVSESLDLRILTLPENLDPCDYLLTQGADAFGHLLDGAMDALEHKLQSAVSGIDPDQDLHGSHAALEDVLATLAKAPRVRIDRPTAARLREDQILNRLARKFGVVEESLRERLTALRRPAHGQRRIAGASQHEQPSLDRAMRPLERELLEVLMLDLSTLPAMREVVQSEGLESPAARGVFQRCCDLADAGISLDFERLLLDFDDPRLKDLLVDLYERGHAKGTENVNDRLHGVIRAWQGEDQRQRQLARTVALRENQLDQASELDILQQIMSQERSRHGIAKPMDG